MTTIRNICAVDIGAESGRVLLGCYDGERLSTRVVHRFLNRPVRLAGTLCWDTPSLYAEMLVGLRLAAQQAGGPIASVGIDTWGSDFGMLDARGDLLGLPVHYRDSRTDGLIDEVLTHLPAQDLYRKSGIVFWPFNSLIQLRALALRRSPLLREGHTLLFTPDLLHYWLSGVKGCERTIASSSQCLAVDRDVWLDDVLATLDIPTHFFPAVTPTGSILGPLRPEVAAEIGAEMQVIAPAGHDTLSAFIAAPITSPDDAYISCGTWSIVGIETDAPIVTPAAFAAGVMNQQSIEGRYSLPRNNMGLWLVQQTRAVLAREGRQYDYAVLAEMAEQAAPFTAWIDPNDMRFYAPENMVEAVQTSCAESGQPVPREVKDLMRCLLESLAFAHRTAIEEFEALRGSRVPAVHIIGGGSQNRTLCQWTANALGRPVIAGPAEATAMGNLSLQLKALGEIANLREIRQVVRQSTELIAYTPQETPAWNEAYERYRQVTKKE